MRTRVFISYSHRDSVWLERLHVHLKPLIRTNLLDVWSDSRISPGQDWKREIDTAIARAKVAILLISADFLASDFIVENELPPLLDKAKNDGALILPIIVSPCRFVETREISKYQALNDPLWPLLKVSQVEQEEIFLKLTRTVESFEVSNRKCEKTSDLEHKSSQVTFSDDPKIMVMGVGGGGGNAVQHMADSGIEGVELVSVNSDVQALKQLKNHNLLQIGKDTSRGLGAGANSEVGKHSADESYAVLSNVLENIDLLFITAGLGGGTGTGAAPVIAEIAREAGILTIAVVTRPFSFEGSKRARLAEEGIRELIQYVDSVIVICAHTIKCHTNNKVSY